MKYIPLTLSSTDLILYTEEKTLSPFHSLQHVWKQLYMNFEVKTSLFEPLQNNELISHCPILPNR